MATVLRVGNIGKCMSENWTTNIAIGAARDVAQRTVPPEAPGRPTLTGEWAGASFLVQFAT